MKPFTAVYISPGSNGISVKVGCKRFFYQQENLAKFCEDLFMYLTDPETAKKTIYERWGIKEEDAPEQPAAPTTQEEGYSPPSSLGQTHQDEGAKSPSSERRR